MIRSAARTAVPEINFILSGALLMMRALRLDAHCFERLADFSADILAAVCRCNVNLLDAPAEVAAQYAALPENLAAARKMMAESAFMRESLPAHLFAAYTE